MLDKSISILCSTWNTVINLKVSKIINNLPSENNPCTIEQIIKTTGTTANLSKNTMQIYGRSVKRKEVFRSLPIYEPIPIKKLKKSI